MKNRYSRREFLRRTCHRAAVASFFIYAPRGGAAPPSERVTIGCIGVGNQGGADTRMFLGDPRAQIVASCDVDLGRAKSMAALIDKHYAGGTASGLFRGCDVTQDYRQILARDDIDAVMIATPDHTHAVIAIEAARRGKDIYCEKPLAYTVAEGRAIVTAVRRYGRVLQTGTQRRSIGRFRFGCEVIRNGRIGRVHTVRIGPGKGFAIRGGFTGEEKPQPVPPDFNYELWLGPAPWAPYTAARCHFNFRWILDYGEGYISDNGVHFVNLATWGTATELTGPRDIDGKATFSSTGIYDAPTEFDITYRYPDGLKLILGSAEAFGVRFEGTGGWVHMSGDAVTAEPAHVLTSPIRTDELHLRPSPGHHADFIDCVLNRRLPAAHAEIGHRDASLCHLGAISARLGRPLRWDPVRETFPDDAAANRFLSRPMRAPWRI